MKGKERGREREGKGREERGEREGKRKNAE